MSNNKTNKNLNQVIFDNNFLPIADIVSSPLKIRYYLSLCARRVLNYLLYLNNKHMHLYPTQEYIAQQLGYSRKTVSRALRELRTYDLLKSWYRFKKSCLYYLSSWFNKPDVRQKLTAFFPSLWLGFSLLLLASVNIHSIEKSNNVPLSNYDIYKNNITNTKKSKNSASVNDQKQYYVKTKNPVYGFDIVSIPGEYVPWYDDESIAMPADVEARFIQQAYEKEQEFELKAVKLSIVMTAQSETAEILLRGFDYFKLTYAGNIRLVKYPAAALLHAEKAIKALVDDMKGQELFDTFVDLCESYCKRHKLEIDHHSDQYLKKVHAVTDDLPSIDSSFVYKKKPEPRPVTPPIEIPRSPQQSRNNNYYDKKPRYGNQEYQPVKSPKQWQAPAPFVEEDPYKAAIKLAKNRLRPEIIAWEERSGFSGNPWLRKCSPEQQREIIALYPKEAQEFKQGSTMPLFSHLANQIVSREPQQPVQLKIGDVQNETVVLNNQSENGNVAPEQKNNGETYAYNRSIEEEYSDFIPPFDDDNSGTEFMFF